MKIPEEVIVDVTVEFSVVEINKVDDRPSVVVDGGSGAVKWTDNPTAIPTVAKNKITKNITHFFFANLTIFSRPVLGAWSHGSIRLNLNHKDYI